MKKVFEPRGLTVDSNNTIQLRKRSSFGSYDHSKEMKIEIRFD